MTTTGNAAVLAASRGSGRRAVILHSFYRVPRDGTLPTDMRLAWQALHDHGFDQPMSDMTAGVTLSNKLPKAPPTRSITLAACRSKRPGVHQAVAFRFHDVVGISVAVAPLVDCEWSELDERTGSSDGDLGNVRIYQYLTNRPLQQDDNAVARLLPSDVLWSPIAWEAAPPNVVVAEAADGDSMLHRRIGLLTDRAHESAIDDWAWSGSARRLPALTRYLLWAAQLRFEYSVYEAGHHMATDRRVRVDEATDRLVTLQATLDGQGVPVHRLLRAEAALTALNTDSSGLLSVRARIRAIGRTATIAVANMTAAANDRPLLPRDRAIGDWLVDQTGDDREYLTAAYERSRDIAESVRASVAARLSQHQQKVTLLQTSVLGALLMALAAIQALMYTLPQLAPLKGPITAVLAALALALPPAVLRGLLRGEGARQPRWFEIAYLAPLGAAAGWLVASVVGRAVSGALPPPWISVPVAAAAAAVTAGIALLPRCDDESADKERA